MESSCPFRAHRLGMSKVKMGWDLVAQVYRPYRYYEIVDNIARSVKKEKVYRRDYRNIKKKLDELYIKAHVVAEFQAFL